MNESRREELRNLLRMMVQERPGQTDASWDQSLGDVLRARFQAEEASASDSFRERALRTMKEAAPVHEVPKASNGKHMGLSVLLSQLKGERHGPRPALLIAAIVGVAAMMLVVFLATRPGNDEIVKTPTVRRQQPLKQVPKAKQGELVHETPRPEIKSPVIEKHPNRPAPRRSAPRFNPTPRHAGLVAARIEIGKVGHVIGWPTISGPGRQKGLGVKPGEKLYAGSIIETGDADRLDIAFADGTSITLDFNTEVAVPAGLPGEKLLKRPKEILVSRGRIVAKVVHAADNSPFVVRTPVATAEDLGTVFSLDLQTPSGPTELLKAVLQVKEGKVAFYNDHGRVVAGALMESTVTAGSAPTEPKRLQAFLHHIPGSTMTYMLGSGVPDELGAAGLVAYDLGWAGLDQNAQPNGEVRVVRVWPGSPADMAGLQIGDIVTSVNGRPVAKPIEVSRAIYRHPGSKIVLGIRRKDHSEMCALTPESRFSATLPTEPKAARRLKDLTELALAGQRSTARRGLDDMLAKTPSAAVYNNLGVLHEMDDHLGEAIRCYQAAIRLDPACPLYHSNLGQALRLIGNADRSLEELRTAAELDKTGWQRLSDLADALNMAGLSEEALKDADEALRRNPRATDAWTTKSDILSNLGRGAEAVTAAKRAVELEPLVHNWNALAAAAMLAGQNELAESSYKKALEISPGDMEALNNYPSLLFRMGRPGEAEKVLKKLTEVAPGFGAGYDNLTVIELRLGKLPEAEAAARKALRINPKDSQAHTNMAAVLRGLGRLEEAVFECRKAIELNPELPNLQSDLGSMLYHLGRLAEAEAELKRAIAIDPKFVTPHPTLGNVYEKQNRFDAAEAEYRTTIALAPKYWVGYSNLGAMYAVLHRTAEAEAAFKQSIEVAPNLPGPYSEFAQFLIDLRRYDEAESQLKKAIEVSGPRIAFKAATLVRLGALNEKKGDKAAAIDAYRQAAAVDPANKEAVAALKRLGG